MINKNCRVARIKDNDMFAFKILDSSRRRNSSLSQEDINLDNHEKNLNSLRNKLWVQKSRKDLLKVRLC